MDATLEGVLVVALEQAVAAPLCTARLADAGARVIKIERAEGDFARHYDTVVQGESAYFVWLNRGKQSLVLDIKEARDAALLGRILARADVYVQNLAPGAAARAGFGSAALRERHPRLITCDISGYGEQGPYRDMKAYDLLVQAESGLVAVSGPPGDYGRVGVSVCDIAAGNSAHAGILQALYRRERTGRGSAIRVSLFDVMAEWMSVPLLHCEYGGRAPERVGLKHPSIAPYGGYRTRDGQTLIISIQNEREWRRLCEQALGLPALAADPQFADNSLRVRHRQRLDAEIGAACAGFDRSELESRLRDAQIAYGAVNSVADLSRHPQLRRSVAATPGGEVRLVAPPLQGAGEREGLGPVPAPGEHSEAIRREFAEEQE